MEKEKEETHIRIETEYGDIEVKLYDDTPLHKENFLKLADKEAYDNVIFHRVIKNFMIQGGDLTTNPRFTPFEEMENDSSERTIPAEFIYPKYYHKRGAFAAARTGDNVNPQKESSFSQFYIVTGNVFSDSDLDMIEKRRFEQLKQRIFMEKQNQNKDLVKELYRNQDKEKLAELKNNLIIEAENEAELKKMTIMFTPKQRYDYKTIGGSPHLDGEYTVYGEVVSGLEVLDKIQEPETDSRDKPLKDIRMKVRIVE